jgi:hypothetical protein
MFTAFYMRCIYHGLLLAQNPQNNRLKRKRSLKKFLTRTITTIPGHMGLDRTDVWFQDEARFGQQNTTTKIWPKKVRDLELSGSNSLNQLIYMEPCVQQQDK